MFDYLIKKGNTPDSFAWKFIKRIFKNTGMISKNIVFWKDYFCVQFLNKFIIKLKFVKFCNTHADENASRFGLN